MDLKEWEASSTLNLQKIKVSILFVPDVLFRLAQLISVVIHGLYMAGALLLDQVCRRENLDCGLIIREM